MNPTPTSKTGVSPVKENIILDLLLRLWRPVLEILIMWFILHMVLLFIITSRAIQVLKGLIILLIACFIFQRLKLDTVNWIVTNLFPISVLALFIIFQPEIRLGLSQIGKKYIFRTALGEEQIIGEIVKSVIGLSKKKIGAIIAIERQSSLKPYIESGIQVDSKVLSELLHTIFMPNTPLHDGGVVVQGGRIVSAACLFPLTQDPTISKTMGTRHRAAIGLTEETDAVVIVVSEETGSVSVASNGKLTRDADKDMLTNILEEIYKSKEEKYHLFFGKRENDKKMVIEQSQT